MPWSDAMELILNGANLYRRGFFLGVTETLPIFFRGVETFESHFRFLLIQ